MPNKNSALRAVCPVCKVREKSVTNRAIERHKRRGLSLFLRHGQKTVVTLQAQRNHAVKRDFLRAWFPDVLHR